jgi:hypothetical protein
MGRYEKLQKICWVKILAVLCDAAGVGVSKIADNWDRTSKW